MSVVTVAVLLGALVLYMLKAKQIKFGAAFACVVFGLVLGATPAGPAVNDILTSAGEWVWARLNEL